MMNSSCRAAIYTALTGLLAAGAITMGVTAASANTAGFCSASSTSTVKATCTVTEQISTPADITVSHNDGVRRPAECHLGLDRHLRHREDLGRFYLDDPGDGGRHHGLQ